MSLRPQPVQPVPEQTARVARTAFPKGNPYIRMRDSLGTLFSDEDFAALFPAHGQPAAPPWRLALICVLQYVEGLTDRQAADAVRGRIDWKYALSLELEDAGFDFSVLSEFRARLVEGGAEQLLLDRMLSGFKERGLIKGRGKQRTDSTHVLADVRALNRLGIVGETLRHALDGLAVAAPEWLREVAPAEWYERYGARFEEGRAPKGKDERRALAEGIGADGLSLLAAIDAPSASAWLREVPAVRTLRRVWIEQYYAPTEPGGPPGWRVPEDLPRSSAMIQSPHDTEARVNTKRETSWIGSQVHVTETCDEDSPHLITHVATTPATTPDTAVTADIQEDLAAKGLLPEVHLADQGYIDSDVLVSSREEHGVDLLGPVPADLGWQARAGEGFDIPSFSIDWDAREITCPEGRRSRYWVPNRDKYGNRVVKAVFDRSDCGPCPSRAKCTRGRGGYRTITVRTRKEHEALVAARRRQGTEEFKEQYSLRAGVEGTISQGTRAFGLRRARYRGLARTHLQHVITAVAINLMRLLVWLADPSAFKPRRSAFAALGASPA